MRKRLTCNEMFEDGNTLFHAYASHETVIMQRVPPDDVKFSRNTDRPGTAHTPRIEARRA